MFGAIVGDVVGSYYEHFPTKSVDFELFPNEASLTDDSVLTIAVADWILHGGQLGAYFHDYVARYPHAGYGGTFIKWAQCRATEPYGSWGNGSAMRVSPAAYTVETLEAVLELAKASAVVTHNHAEGIRGAQATAGAVFLARKGNTKKEIREFVTEMGYDLSRSLDEIRPAYVWDVSCAGSVPESITAFLESDSFVHAIRLAISLGGDADTMACIAGAIAEPFYYGIPTQIFERTRGYLDETLLDVVDTFYASIIKRSPCGD